jgi:hypothetical protein
MESGDGKGDGDTLMGAMLHDILDMAWDVYQMLTWVTRQVLTL